MPGIARYSHANWARLGELASLKSLNRAWIELVGEVDRAKGGRGKWKWIEPKGEWGMEVDRAKGGMGNEEGEVDRAKSQWGKEEGELQIVTGCGITLCLKNPCGEKPEARGKGSQNQEINEDTRVESPISMAHSAANVVKDLKKLNPAVARQKEAIREIVDGEFIRERLSGRVRENSARGLDEFLTYPRSNWERDQPVPPHGITGKSKWGDWGGDGSGFCGIWG
ncbi:hypothetical protein BY996DRAFT_6616069 [Phakopsora pachyrhizi]|nr:hypothetical protein BY996DRAFT_6616069 [Phakopsora pachyrhizi]